MTGDVKLYGEICKVLRPKSEKKQKQLWDIIRKYNIRTICDSSSFDTGYKKFMEAKTCEGCSKSTLNSYKNTINAFKKYLDKDITNLEEITKDDIRGFLSQQEAKGKKKTSIAQNLGVLKNFFMWLEYENYIFKNPAKTIMYKVPKVQKHALTTDELESIYKNCRTIKEKALIHFLANTGCRVSEVTGLKLSEVDFDKNIATVFGKGSKTRQVFFNDETKKYLKANQKKNKSQYLFYSEKNNRKPIERFAVEACVRRLGERIGLDRNLHPHIFRHSFATNALNSGMNLIDIQKLLGHSDLSTTQIYAERNIENIRNEYNRVFNS